MTPFHGRFDISHMDIEQSCEGFHDAFIIYIKDLEFVVVGQIKHCPDPQ